MHALSVDDKLRFKTDQSTRSSLAFDRTTQRLVKSPLPVLPRQPVVLVDLPVVLVGQVQAVFAVRAGQPASCCLFLLFGLFGVTPNKPNGKNFRDHVQGLSSSGARPIPIGPLKHGVMDGDTLDFVVEAQAAVLTSSKDRIAKIWDFRTGQCNCTLSGHRDELCSAACAPDGRSVVTSSRDKTAKIWDAATGACKCTLSGHKNHVLSAAYSPDGASVVTPSRDGTAKLWDAETGKCKGTLLGHGSRWVHSVAYSQDSAFVITASEDGTARPIPIGWSQRAQEITE